MTLSSYETWELSRPVPAESVEVFGTFIAKLCRIGGTPDAGFLADRLKSKYHVVQ